MEVLFGVEILSRSKERFLTRIRCGLRRIILTTCYHHDRFVTHLTGFISREEAEGLLSTKPAGTYLIRLSDRIWGYALSYRVATGTCRHYLIDASDGKYRFFGTSQTHGSLHDLVHCHKVAPFISFLLPFRRLSDFCCAAIECARGLLRPMIP